VDPAAVRQAYDEQVRRRPGTHAPGAQVERADGVVRVVSATGWSGVTWSGLEEGTADVVIAAQVQRFSGLSRSWEWKYYSHDTPPDLPGRLVAAGLVAEPAETLLVAEIADLALDASPPPGVELRPVTDAAGVRDLVRVGEEVFGEDYSALGSVLTAQLAQHPDSVAAVVAVTGDRPIAAGRVEFCIGTPFAGLWGGGTLPAWRGRGVFRALVAHRAALAAARGFRYLQVDASDDSRPIPRRLGFVELATTTPYAGSGS